MSGINTGRVLLGGLLAGLVLSLGEFVLSMPILGGLWDSVIQEHNLPGIGMSRVAVFIVMNLVLGVAVVCLYASIRPRYGAGPKTAVRAGLILWFLVWLYGYTVGAVLGYWPPKLTIIAALWGFFEAPIAAVVGASVYREG